MFPISRHSSSALRWLTWSSVGLGVQGLGQFVVVAVLARFLTAADFGVVTATLVVIGFGKAITQAVIGPALVQREALLPGHVRTAVAISLWSSAAMVAALWLAAPALAGFFRMDELADVMRALSLMFLCQAPGLVPEALLQRDLNLRGLALADIAGTMLGYLPLGVVLAATGCGVWSLVIAHVGQALLRTVLMLVLRPHQGALLPAAGPARDLLYFSGGFVAARLCNYAASQSDNFVVGRWMTAADLGVYGRAYQLMAMPAMFLGEVIDRVLFPLLARSQSDKDRLCRSYSQCVSLVVTIMTPAAAAGAILAPEAVHVVLGPGWDEVVLPFQILMAGLVFRTGYKISDSVARATGTVYARAWRQAVFAASMFGGALIGTRWGVGGVAVGVVAALGVNYFLMAGLSILTTGLGWTRFALLHLRGLLVGAAFGAAVLAPSLLLRQSTAPPLAVLLLALGSASALFGLAAWAAPVPVLGADGLWLLQKLAGRERT